MIKVISLLLLYVSSSFVLAETQYEAYKDSMKLTQDIVAKKRNDLVLKKMGLSVHEEKSFFDIYNAYRDEMKPMLDQEAKLITDYADTYVKKNLTDKQALTFVNTFLDLKSQKIALRKKYVGEFKGMMSPKHIARFIQLENKLDAIIAFSMAQEVPLVPVK